VQHLSEIPGGNSFVYCCQIESASSGSFRYDLSPAFSQSPLHGEYDAIRGIPLKMFERGQDEVRLAVYNGLGSEWVLESDKQFLDKEFESIPGSRSPPLGQAEEEAVQSMKMLPEGIYHRLGRRVLPGEWQENTVNGFSSGCCLSC
jgi:hypothetical protein